jgi:hypothetical protein
MLFRCLFRGRYPVTGLHATMLWTEIEARIVNGKGTVQCIIKFYAKNIVKAAILHTNFIYMKVKIMSPNEIRKSIDMEFHIDIKDIYIHMKSFL